MSTDIQEFNTRLRIESNERSIRKDEYASRFGYVQATGVACPLRLVNKSCKPHYLGRRKESCKPEGYSHYLLYDHATIWKKDGKLHEVQFQPYGLGAQECAFLSEFCNRWGLTFSVSGSSFHAWHSPGGVVSVAIAKANGA